jgi:hypothetical protein
MLQKNQQECCNIDSEVGRVGTTLELTLNPNS